MPGWNGRPSLGGAGTRPLPVKSLILVVLVAWALGIHLYRRAETTGLPARPNISGKAWVIDGDTIQISGSRIRLEGIDAPEAAQSCADLSRATWACGSTASRELRLHVAGRRLQCRATGIDKYKRILAICVLPDGSDVNGWMVRQGWALAYGYSGHYRAEEADAKAARRGIWAGNFTPPWEWRRRHLERTTWPVFSG
jgi:endonuclease YncB( thermonuclease family)